MSGNDATTRLGPQPWPIYSTGRLGLGGDYYPRGVDDAPTWAARYAALDAVRHFAPEVLESLRDEVLPAYRVAAKLPPFRRRDPSTGKITSAGIGAGQLSWRMLESHLAVVGPDDLPPNVSQLRSQALDPLLLLKQKIVAWSERYNLNVEWVWEVALQTLAFWEEYPPWLNELLWYYRGLDVETLLTPQECQCSFSWDPLFQTEADADEQLRLAWQEHKTRLKTLIEQRGAKQAPEKRNPEHFRWWALARVVGRSYEDIAQEYTDTDPSGNRTIGTDAIRKAVVAINRLVDLPTGK